MFEGMRDEVALYGARGRLTAAKALLSITAKNPSMFCIEHRGPKCFAPKIISSKMCTLGQRCCQLCEYSLSISPWRHPMPTRSHRLRSRGHVRFAAGPARFMEFPVVCARGAAETPLKSPTDCWALLPTKRNKTVQPTPPLVVWHRT